MSTRSAPFTIVGEERVVGRAGGDGRRGVGGPVGRVVDPYPAAGRRVGVLPAGVDDAAGNRRRAVHAGRVRARVQRRIPHPERPPGAAVERPEAGSRVRAAARAAGRREGHAVCDGRGRHAATLDVDHPARDRRQLLTAGKPARRRRGAREVVRRAGSGVRSVRGVAEPPLRVVIPEPGHTSMTRRGLGVVRTCVRSAVNPSPAKSFSSGSSFDGLRCQARCRSFEGW